MDTRIVKIEAPINLTDICIYWRNHTLLENLVVILICGHEKQMKF